MRVRTVVGIAAAVAVVHWCMIWGPVSWGVPALVLAPAQPAPMQAVWVTMPSPEPEPSIPQEVKPAAEPASPRPPSRRRIAPVAPPAPEPLPSITVPAADAVTVQEGEVVDAAEAVQPQELEHLPATPVVPQHPAGPTLQVRDAQGAAVTLALPDDGSALQQHMLLRYKVHGFVKQQEYHAHAELEWQVGGGQYQARQSISAFLLGSMEQHSTGLMSEQGLQPLDFSDRRFFKTRFVHFDWAAGQALFTPERPAARIGTGAQDRLSVFMQLAAMLQAMPQLHQPGVRIETPVLGSRSLQMWTFVVEGDELLELPAGAVQTLRLHRQPKAGEAETAQLWVDPARGFVPVRIHMQEANGDEMDLSLKR
ncbi:DUF3108 domain-containing protein [Comamonas kerstersii]|uniref:DUF3108 domain-containing protein n=1 Tax=Comamonas kerstersii TaxID=225992 RepID=UPI0009877F15|nr:DUF3108 domain-containing protein [Comamonas kerstersii]OOH87022.1 hypothetical protein BMF38_08355 [Comamonas kerstersii]OOH89961.1 hypothetical protein BMF29_13375 [Comamonas kerstersii]